MRAQPSTSALRTRIDELRTLKDGWLEGHGRAPSSAKLDWFAAAFDAFFTGKLPSPYVFPTEEGGLRLEWEVNGADVSVDVDLTLQHGTYQCLNPDGSDEQAELDLAGDAGWVELGRRLTTP